MKSRRPIGLKCLIFSVFFVALLCVFNSINEVFFKFRGDMVILEYLGACSFRLNNLCIYGNSSSTILTTSTTNIHVSPSEIPQNPRREIEFPLNCTSGNLTRFCPAKYYPANFSRSEDDQDRPPATSTCPDYFRWIHEDLRPWKETGITKEMMDRGWERAHFKLKIFEGRAYIQTRRRAPNTRDIYTQWSILQLLRRYAGRIPDLELMFNWADIPIYKSANWNATAPPPMFGYDGDDETVQLVFPDWAFWGWPEKNIKPWDEILQDLKEKEGNWIDKEAYAHWRGDPVSHLTRRALIRHCNPSDKQDWGARVYKQDWGKETQEGFKKSDLASQCMHRYKIYVEGHAWSVSEKYILACNSVAILVKPQYYDFFTRALMPMQHYWPINHDDLCRSIKFAVEWGNSHEQEAQAIGKAGSDFVRENVTMDHVYDYMFHLLNEYAKLLRYNPSKPERMFELCSEIFACPATDLRQKFMMESMVKGPRDASPCNMPPPYDDLALRTILETKANAVSQVELWQKRYWENQTEA